MEREQEIIIGTQQLEGTIYYPHKESDLTSSGVIYLHGWGSENRRPRIIREELPEQGCVTLGFDLQGHGKSSDIFSTVSRQQNLEDMVNGYDVLAKNDQVDPSKIGTIGYSYGGYLAVHLTEVRDVAWLILRSPALYKDEDMQIPKSKLREIQNLKEYRKKQLTPENNRTLEIARRYTGDVLIIEAENDTVIPHIIIENYLHAFQNAKTKTYAVIEGAGHVFKEKKLKKEYRKLVTNWLVDKI